MRAGHRFENVAPIHVKFVTTEGNVGASGRAKFHANLCTGRWPPKFENFHFLVKSCPLPFDRCLQMLGLLCAQLPCIIVFYVSRDSVHNVTELLQINGASVICPNFPRTL